MYARPHVHAASDPSDRVASCPAPFTLTGEHTDAIAIRLLEVVSS